MMKNKILKTAFNLMCKKNIKDVSMREIAEFCNVSKAALYYHFKDKDEICYEVMKFIFEKQKKDVESYNTISNKNFKIFIYQIFEKTFQFKGKQSLSFFLHFIDYIKSNNSLKKKLLPLKETNEKILKDIFVEESKKDTIDFNKIDLGLHVFHACLAHIVFIPEYEELNNINYKEMADVVLLSLNYREKENKI